MLSSQILFQSVIMMTAMYNSDYGLGELYSYQSNLHAALDAYK